MKNMNRYLWITVLMAVFLTGSTTIADAKVKKGKSAKTITKTNKNRTKKTVASKSKNLTFTVNGVKFVMVAVEGGVISTYDPANFRSHNNEDVTLKPYFIGQTEVTQALWEAVMGNNPSSFKNDMFPVTNVSWNDCNDFISKLNKLTGKEFRLPSFAEWTFAAKGGNLSKNYKYSGSNDLDKVAWHIGNCGEFPQPHIVATKMDNELGIYDMNGNVSEWTSNYDDGIRASGNNLGRCPPSAVVVGGSFYHEPQSILDVETIDVFSSHHNNIGLRLAL